MDRFTGYIAGFGTASGTRCVVGHWLDSPLGAFTDVMVEHRDGGRTLLAPNRTVTDYVSATYRFDRVVTAPIEATLHPGGPGGPRLRLIGGPLDLTAELGAVTPLGRLLELVPVRLAVHPRWLAAISPVAGLLVRGVATAGSAGGGRREFYGVRSIRTVERVEASWAGRSLGPLAPVEPPVRFGFSSVPRRPQAVAVTTTILPAPDRAGG
ncbi:MAG: hypothetical protein ABWX68_08690 [Arthrobacter sp.]|uniref:hypothetical protein n=1 Tax=Arthrobacter sp. TaxID=1667 RepID=UPI00348D7389